MRVLIFGARGWLGTHYLRFFDAQPGYVAIPASADVRSMTEIRRDLDRAQPDLVINSAGKTHSATIPNIEACVENLDARIAAHESNALGAGNVAIACNTVGVKLVHLSTGYVFSGNGPFAESDTPDPQSWYAITKTIGEQLIQSFYPETLILRIQMPISAVPHPRNLLAKLIQAPLVADVAPSITVVEDLMEWTRDLALCGVTGLVHAVHPKPMPYREILDLYRARADPSFTYQLGRSDRPACVLHTRRDLPVAFLPTAISVTRTLTAYAREVHAQCA